MAVGIILKAMHRLSSHILFIPTVYTKEMKFRGVTEDAQFPSGEGEILTQTVFMLKPLCFTLAFFCHPGVLPMILKTVQKDLTYLGF